MTVIGRNLIEEVHTAATALVEAVTFDDSGTNGVGGNGGLLSRETIRKCDELRIALLRAEGERRGKDR